MAKSNDPYPLIQRYLAACAVTREAGKLALSFFKDVNKLAVKEKGPMDLTCMADREVETFIVAELAKGFPEDDFFGEELGGTPGSKLWVIDPIDGTSNFVLGIPFFCVSLAYLLNGAIEIGVIYDPIADELFSAHRGSGAICNGKAVHVSDCSDIEKTIVGFDFNHRTNLKRFLTAHEQLLKTKCNPRQMGAGALTMAHVANGSLDSYWNLHLYPWDALAALLLVQEAGGWTNNFLAGDGLTRGGPALVCTPGIKDVLITATGII